MSAHRELTMFDRAKCRRPVVLPFCTQFCQDHFELDSSYQRDALSVTQMLRLASALNGRIVPNYIPRKEVINE